MTVCDGFITLPSAEEGDNIEVLGNMPDLISVQYEPVGRWFEASCRRRLETNTLSHQSLESSESESEEGELQEDPEEENLLRALDPKEWKDQDHYAVLGLTKERYRATDDQIKRAYKRKVLRHHPDKRRARGVPVKEGEEDYFTCITRAYEILGVPSKRRSFDSVDPTFIEWIPSGNQDSSDDFFKVFRPVFERNARWSNKKRVPDLGHESTPFEAVNKFYSFWYDFDSWREYSYLDEEDKEKGENREERRWIDKQNKAARQKRKKEEVIRIRQLVDNAYGRDPRIASHKEGERQRKLAEKQAKRDAARAKAEEEERIKQAALDEQRKQKEKEEEEARALAAAAKKEKEALKKAVKKERKTFRSSLKEFDYFSDSDEARRLGTMQDVEKLAEWLSLTSLQSLNKSLTSGDKDKAKSAFNTQLDEMNESEEEEKRRQLDLAKGQGSGGGSSSGSRSPFTDEEVQVLIKAVNLFPAGTVQRWETVANFITQHVPSSKRSAKEVLAKAKELQHMDTNLKEEANKKAFQVFSKTKGTKKEDKASISERYDSVAEQQIAETGTNPAPWTAEEQKKLEQGLKTFPASVADRWEKISDAIATRSKKDCMIRYKELVQTIRAKKAAQQAAATKKK